MGQVAPMARQMSSWQRKFGELVVSWYKTPCDTWLFVFSVFSFIILPFVHHHYTLRVYDNYNR
jgi:hypothetical protein